VETRQDNHFAMGVSNSKEETRTRPVVQAAMRVTEQAEPAILLFDDITAVAAAE
jgi:hypothetical protein